MKWRSSRKQPRTEMKARPAKMFCLPQRAKWLVPALIICFILVGLFLRGSDLGADPPQTLSWSFAPHTDGWLNSYSARSLVLYGAWKTDDFFPFVIYPLFNVLVALVFRLLGFGLVQMKLISLLAGVAVIWVVYLLVKREAGRIAGLVAALATAVCFPLVMYDRLGLVEPVQVLFLLLAGFFFSRGIEKPWLMVLSGFFAAGTLLLVKISALFVAPVMVVMFAWQFFASRKDPEAISRLGRGLGLWFAGVGVALVVWFLVVFLPHRNDYIQYVLRHSLESPYGHPETLLDYLLSIFAIGETAMWISRLPFVALLGFLFLPGFGIGRRPGLRYLFIWFVFAVLMLGYMNYRPPRYEIILILPLIAAFGAALGRLVEKGTLLPEVKPGLLKSVLFSIWLWPLVLQLAFYSGGFWGALQADTAAGLLGLTFGISLGLVVIGHVVLRLVRQEVVARSIAVRAVLAVVLLVLVLRFDLAQYFDWFGNRTHYLVEYSQDLDRILPDDAVLAGGWAPVLLTNPRKRALCITDWANSTDPVARYGVTHLVAPAQGPEFMMFITLYPDLMWRARLIRRYVVRKISISGERKDYILDVHELGVGR